jgi:hypothetical protein
MVTNLLEKLTTRGITSQNLNTILQTYYEKIAQELPVKLRRRV